MQPGGITQAADISGLSYQSDKARCSFRFRLSKSVLMTLSDDQLDPLFQSTTDDCEQISIPFPATKTCLGPLARFLPVVDHRFRSEISEGPKISATSSVQLVLYRPFLPPHKDFIAHPSFHASHLGVPFHNLGSRQGFLATSCDLRLFLLCVDLSSHIVVRSLSLRARSLFV